MWEIKGNQLDPGRFTPIKPLKVLNYYDGPRIFTCLDADHGLCLACWSDEDNEVVRFVVVPCTDHLITQLEKGALSVREALEQPRTWLIDVKKDGEIKAVIQVKLADVPTDALPQQGVMLHRSLEPLLSVRALGALIQPGEIPGSVIRFAVEGAQKSIKALAEHELKLQPQGGRPLRALKRLYDLPTQSLRAASFEVVFRSPLSEPDLFAGMTEPEVRAETDVLDRVGNHLRVGLAWLAEGASNKTLPVPNDRELSQVIVRALKHLTPPSQGPIREVELRGGLIHRLVDPIRLDRSAREVVNAVLRQFPLSAERRVRLVGRIRELDADAFRFELRDIEGDVPVRACVFDPELWDDVRNLLGEEILVEVLGIETAANSQIQVLDLGQVPEEPRSEHSRGN